MNWDITTNAITTVMQVEPEPLLWLYGKVFFSGVVTQIFFMGIGKVIRSLKVFTGIR